MTLHKVVINAGHGGHDSGAVNKFAHEEDINLKVAKYLKVYLEAKGVVVGMTRTSDVYSSLSDIAKFINNFGGELAVSIHHNAGGGDGFEVIHSVKHGKGLVLATEIANQFKKLGQNPHGVGYHDRYASDGVSDYYTVINKTVIPCVITEYGFMDTVDYQAFDTDVELQREALAIGKAICICLGVSILDPVKPKVVVPMFPKGGLVLADMLNVRQGAGTSFPVIGQLRKGERVKIAGLKNGFYSIYFGDHGGYVSTKFIK